jgi:hypothetical protein
MKFVFPAFLFSLFVLAIPVIIHLFHFRRFRQVLFSNIRFLKLIKNEKQSKNNLKQLILLILRLLAFAFLVFAFAQPYIPVKNNPVGSGKMAVSIYIDNSMSMENVGSSGTLLDNAKKIAAEIVKAYDINDQFQVITNDFENKHQRFYQQDHVQSLISNIGISPRPKMMSTVFQKQISNLNEAKLNNRVVYILSDMQKNTADIEKLSADTSVVRYMIPLIAPASYNIAIDSAWMDKPILRLNQQVNLGINIVNYSDKNVEDATITLQINGVQKGLANFSLAADQTVNVQVPFTITEPGWNRLQLHIIDYPYTFDDDYYMSFFVRDKIQILSLNSNNISNPFIRAVYATDNYFAFSQNLVSSFNQINLKDYRFLILNEISSIDAGLISKLISYVAEGGNLLLIPSSQPNMKPDLYNSLLSNFGLSGFDRIENSELKVRTINYEHPVLKGIFSKIPKNADLPMIKKFYARQSGINSAETSLIGLDNRQSLLSYIPYLKGNVFLLNVPLNDEWSGLQRHALFLPVMYQLAMQYVNSIPLSYELIPNKSIVLSEIDFNRQSLISMSKGNNSFIPDQRIINGQLNIFTNENFNESGFYTVSNASSTDKNKPVIAFNYSRNESNTTTYSMQELNDLSEKHDFNLVKSKHNNSKVIIEKIKSGRPLWKVCLIIALALLITEILLIRFWKM